MTEYRVLENGNIAKYVKKSNRKWDMRAEQIVRSYVS